MPEKPVVKKMNCLNCETAIQGKFCVHCGQPTNTGKINFKETITSFLSLAFALEGPFWLTIQLIIVNPGKLFREFIGGKRKTYYKPVAFFFLISAVYLILRALINFDPLKGESVKSDLADLALVSEKIGETFRLMSRNINNIMFLLVFSIALILKLFYRKKYNLAEYTSIGLFITGMYTLLKIFTMFVGKYALVEVDNLELLILLILIFYSSLSLFQKYDFWSLSKYLLISVFSLVLYIVFGVGFFLLIVMLK